MTDLIVKAPTAAEIGEGKTKRHLAVSGPDEPPGQTGPSRLLGNGDYYFRQPVPAEKWPILHGLGKYPDLTVQNTGGVEQLAIVEYVSANELVITFSEPTQGYALLTNE